MFYNLFPERTVDLIVILAPLIPLSYIDSVTDSMLKGINKQNSVIKFSITDSIISIIMILTIVPLCGIKGYIIMLYIGTIINVFLGLNCLAKTIKIRLPSLNLHKTNKDIIQFDNHI